MLPRYDRLGASSRYRLLQYVPLFERAGNDLEVWPLLTNQYLNELYKNDRRPASVLFTGYQRRLRRILDVTAFDVVICEQESFPYLPGCFEKLLRRWARLLILDYDDAAYVRYQRTVFLRNKISRLMASADSVVVGNHHLATHAEQFSTRVTVIPSVVDLARYHTRQRRLDSNIVRIVWIGTPITAHTLDPLIPVFERVQKKHPRVSFRLIGAGNSLNLHRLCFESPEWSENSELGLLSECDLGIMPLPDTEFARGKCGLKLIQYMASGLPVVASPVGVNQEIVRHGHNGFLASSPAEWEEALCCLVANFELRVRMGREAREYVQDRYTLEHGFAKWMEVLTPLRVVPSHLETLATANERQVAATF